MFQEVELNVSNSRGRRIVILQCESNLTLVAIFAMKQIQATGTG